MKLREALKAKGSRTFSRILGLGRVGTGRELKDDYMTGQGINISGGNYMD